jgi:hypothetical protein
MINLKRRLKVLTLRFRKMILTNLTRVPDKNYLQIQKKAEIIIMNLINSPKSNIYYHNEVFYIKNENILVRFDQENAHITNGSYSYYISLGEYTCTKIKNKYKSNIKILVSEFDENNDINTINNLNKILESI